MNFEKIKNYIKNYDIKEDFKKNKFRIIDFISWILFGFAFWAFLYYYN